MADTKLDRDVARILGNQGWIKSALGELLTNNAKIIANQATQITALNAMLVVLTEIRDQHSTEDEALLAINAIQENIELLISQL